MAGLIRLLFVGILLGGAAFIDHKMWTVATTPVAQVLAIAIGTVFAVYALALSVHIFDDD